MGFYYFDASTLVKRGNTVYIAEVSVVEVAAALAILTRTNHISLRDRDLAYRRFLNDTAHLYYLVPVRTDDFHAAARLTQRHPLKAYDAIQLAVALRYQALARRKLNLIFVSGDKQQLRAAAAEGLATDNPFGHLP